MIECFNWKFILCILVDCFSERRVWKRYGGDGNGLRGTGRSLGLRQQSLKIYGDSFPTVFLDCWIAHLEFDFEISSPGLFSGVAE